MAPARHRQNPVTSQNDAGLRGRLEQFGLAAVLSFLELERRSGQILIVARDKMGRVWLRGGQVLSARIEGSRRVIQRRSTSSCRGTADTSPSRRRILLPTSTRLARPPRCFSWTLPDAPTKRPRPRASSPRTSRLCWQGRAEAEHGAQVGDRRGPALGPEGHPRQQHEEEGDCPFAAAAAGRTTGRRAWRSLARAPQFFSS